MSTPAQILEYAMHNDPQNLRGVDAALINLVLDLQHKVAVMIEGQRATAMLYDILSKRVDALENLRAYNRELDKAMHIVQNPKYPCPECERNISPSFFEVERMCPYCRTPLNPEMVR